MTPDEELPYSRRKLLASVGVVGTASLGFARGNRRVSGTEPSYPNVTYAATEGPELRIGWHATYDDGRDGDSLRTVSPGTGAWDHDNTAEYADDLDDDGPEGPVGPAGPVFDLDDVVPGDSGTLSVGLQIGEESQPGTVWARRLLAGEGALASVIDIELWYDTGIFGVGGCQGAESGSFGGPVVTGTLAEPDTSLAATGSLEAGLRLDPGVVTADCLEPGDRLCLGFRWSIDEEVGNAYQGEGMRFALDFGAVSCEFDGNPFAAESAGVER